MKFNDKYLSIPPYISTGWENVKALQMSGNLLMITLSDSNTIAVPNLDMEEIQQIFQAHASFLETVKSLEAPSEKSPASSPREFNNPFYRGGIGGQPMDFPFKIGVGGVAGMEGLGAALQHNPSHANAPNLPSEILTKIASIAKIVSPDGSAMEAPQPEPHCNCPHCQIARAINEGLGNPVRPFSEEGFDANVIHDEEVSDEDLSFQQWRIEQVGEKLYLVSNKLDPEEKYNVFLGEPVGCTCGRVGCEHILAVLKS